MGRLLVLFFKPRFLTLKKIAIMTHDYNKVKEDIKAILKKPDYDDGSLGPVFVRLAWHASGTF